MILTPFYGITEKGEHKARIMNRILIVAEIAFIAASVLLVFDGIYIYGHPEFLRTVFTWGITYRLGKAVVFLITYALISLLAVAVLNRILRKLTRVWHAAVNGFDGK